MTPCPAPLPDPAADPLGVLLPRLNRRARRLVDDPADAADLAQEALLKVWQRTCDGGAPIDDMTAYAMTALRNAARSAWRKHHDTEILHDDDASTQPDAPRMIACAEARAAIRRLPQDQARLMALVALGETSPAVLARLTGVPKGTVMSRLARARASLRADMGMAPGESVRSLY